MTNHCEIRPMLPKMRTSMQKLVIFCILIINYWSFAKSAIIQNGNLTLDVTIVDEGMTVKLTWSKFLIYMYFGLNLFLHR